MEVIKDLIPFLLLTVLSSSLATLKNILLAKGQKNAAYITIFLDALIFSSVLKKISGGDGLLFGIAYAVGKMLGAMLGNKIEEFLALGILEVEISVNHFDKMILIADELRDSGYTVETYSVYGYGGKKRYKIQVVISRKEKDNLTETLKKHGYDQPTMIIRGVSNVTGKIII